MTRPTGKPKGRPMEPLALLEEDAMERISIGHELVSNDAAERAALERLYATEQQALRLSMTPAVRVALESCQRLTGSLLTYDDAENARHQQLAAPVQMRMSA